MGCDGGTIPTRDELVRTKQNPEKKDKDFVRIYKWQYCHLTQQKLTQPIVACQLGRLYNKEAIVVEPAGALTVSALDFYKDDIPNDSFMIL